MLLEAIVFRKPGETDDLVMSMVIACRMVNYISTFEDDIFDVVNRTLEAMENLSDDESFDEYDEPNAQLDYFR